MGISKQLLENYKTIEKKCKYFNTPFGKLIVKINNINVPFTLSKKKYTLKNIEKKEIGVDVFRIELETNGLKMNDIINIKFEEERRLEYYAADENILMISEMNNGLLLAVIAYDSEFNYNDMEFYNGNYYSYALKKINDNGVEYEVLSNPKEHLNFNEGHIINVWIMWTSDNNFYNANEELFNKLG